jgi:hypothetical protein
MEAAHGEVAQYAGAGGSPANDQNFGFDLTQRFPPDRR